MLDMETDYTIGNINMSVRRSDPGLLKTVSAIVPKDCFNPEASVMANDIHEDNLTLLTRSLLTIS